MANTVLKILHEYQEFIEVELKKDNYLLPKSPPLDMLGDEESTMVIPKVTTGCLPHTNFSLYGAANEFFQAPYIMVGMDDNSADMDSSKTQIMIQVCCYSSGLYITDEQDERYELKIPDNKAFEDCINLLEWIRQKIIEKGSIKGTTVERPIQLGSYNSKELTYPYSFGYLSFEALSVPLETNRTRITY